MADTEPNQTKAYNEPIRVPINGGEYTAKIRRWTMKDRAEFRPLLAAVLEKVAASPGSDVTNIAQVFLAAEDEMFEVARAAAELPDGLEWDDLGWPDGMSLVQAVWETNIMSVDGGGIMGKSLGMLANVLRILRVRQLVQSAQSSETTGEETTPVSPNQTNPSSTSNSPDSPISPDVDTDR